MRLLIVVNYADFFLSHRLVLALGARSRGWDVQVAGQEGPLVPRVREHGLPYHVLPRMRGETRPLHELATLRALISLYRKLRPDVVHHVSIKPVLYGGLAARVTAVPAVVSAISGLGSVFLAGGLAARARRAAVQAAYRAAFTHPNATVIVQNEDDRRFAIEIGGIARAATVLIPGSGVDLSAFDVSPEPDGVPIVVLPARILRDKGVCEFVSAARACKARGVVARFVLVGPSDPDNPTAVSEAEIGDWVSSGVVEWWGMRKDMPAVYRQATVVCLPSYREGLSKSLIEAAASARGIVTTDVPGCRDVVRDREHGLLVPPRDARALAAALGEMLGDAAGRRRMAAAARARAVAEFGVDAVVGRTMEIYDEALRRASTSR